MININVITQLLKPITGPLRKNKSHQALTPPDAHSISPYVTSRNILVISDIYDRNTRDYMAQALELCSIAS
jgi:hypothetical protein